MCNGGDEMNSNKLKGIMRERGITQKNMANELGITVQAFNAKLNGRSRFVVDEAMQMVQYLNIENPVEIFLSGKSQISNERKT